MAYISQRAQFQSAIQPYRPATVPAQPPARSWFRNALAIILDGRKRQVERDIARFVSRRGKMTDNLEREIAERFLTADWRRSY